MFSMAPNTTQAVDVATYVVYQTFTDKFACYDISVVSESSQRYYDDMLRLGCPRFDDVVS